MATEAGGLEAAIAGARDYAPHTLRICCEVETLDEVSRVASSTTLPPETVGHG